VNAPILGAVARLDDLARIDHSFLRGADECWYLAEYISGAGSTQVSQLIANLKCSPSAAAANARRRRRKQRAIEVLAAALRHAVSQSWAEAATWIPVPPSRAARDQDYDDRLLRILRRAFAGYDSDIRTVLFQLESVAADHCNSKRVEIQSLFECIRVNWSALESRPLRNRLVVFDDVLTTGKHYRCCERRLREVLPTIPISGLFVARRVLSGRGRRMPLDGGSRQL
jgi:predicted amidophosphoribosyltransferase